MWVLGNNRSLDLCFKANPNLTNLRDLENVRRELYGSFFKKSFPNFKHKCPQKYLPYIPEQIGELAVPYFETDKFVVKTTQLEKFIEHSKRPVQVSSYIVVGSWFKVLAMGLIILIGTFALFKCGRFSLRKYDVGRKTQTTFRCVRNN